VAKRLTDYQRAERSLPLCMVGALMGDEKDVSDLAFKVETQIDLTEEGQDDTNRRDLKTLRNWLKKWWPQSDYLPKETL
jgi:hypothetical protein